MSGAAGVTAATPDPSIRHLQADEWRIKQMSDREKLVSTCMFCKTLYRNPGVANKCEHYHYPIPTLKL